MWGIYEGEWLAFFKSVEAVLAVSFFVVARFLSPEYMAHNPNVPRTRSVCATGEFFGFRKKNRQCAKSKASSWIGT